MTLDSQTARQFFERAEKEANRYGEDPWVFLRELVQNSRDATAANIILKANTVGGWEQVSCVDDGEGMDEYHFKNYFLCLYASSKEESRDAVGFFGVGFWSVLLFKPEIIHVTSAREGRALSFKIDCVNHTIESVSPGNWQKGTRIVIQRRQVMEEAEFTARVRERLLHYCEFVRPARGLRKLTVSYNGVPFNKPFPLPNDCGRKFKTAHFDGVLGFGPKPMIRLYKGGILVRSLSSLQELIPSRVPDIPHSWGLFPNIHINIESLQVLMDRQKVFEDPVLHKAVGYCEQQLTRMQRNLVRDLFPMNLKNRVWGMFDRLRTARFDKRFTYWALIMLLACLPWIFKPDLQHLLPEFGPIFGGGGTGSGGSGSQVQTLNNALRNWGGSIIDSPTGEGYEWDFSYIGPAKIFFRMGTFSRYDPARGFFPGNGGRLTTYPDFIDRGEAKVAVSLGVSGGGSLVLPLPPGYVLVKSSISGLSGFPVAQNQFGEPVIQNLPEIDFTLGYTAIKRAFPIQPPPMTSANPGEWPAEYRDLIDSARAIDAGAAVNMFSLFIRSRFAYTDRRELASIFHSHPGSWLQKTIGTGAGDCDILNGLLVLMMRSAGHQAFLSVGLVGDNGRARPTLHAWARYYHNGWQSIDITEHAVALSSLVAGTTTGGQAEELLPSLLNNLPGPTPGADPSEGIESENPGVGNAGEGPFSYWLLPLAVLVAFCAWFFLRRREHIAESDKPAFITDLFEHYFYHGRDDMDLQLKFRPVFPLLSGGKISLFEMQQQVDSGTLLSGRGDDRLLPLLADGYQVLNVDSPVVANLIGFLPTMTWLHDFEAIASGHQRHPNLVAAEGVIRELDASFRVYQVPKTDEFTEARLRFADEGMGEHHILVGEEHPVFKKLTATVGADMDLQVFQAVQLLLNKTTFYLNEKNLFLERLARRAPGWSGARMQGAFQ